MAESTTTIKLRIIVSDIVTQFADGYDQIQVHRATTQGGTYTEITNTLTRIDLIEKQAEYVFEDDNGRPTFWYKWRLYRTSDQAEGTFSTEQIGGYDPALEILSVDELKSYYLFGIDLTDDEGNEYPPQLYAHFIKSAVAQLEHRLDIPIAMKAIDEERHDYYREDYDKYIWVELDHFPAMTVQEVRLVLPGEQVVQVFEDDWIHIQKETGHLQLVPGTGTAGTILLGASGAWLPLIYGNNRYIPDVFRVRYVAGFVDLPADIKDIVGKIASFGPLNIAGDLLGGAGIASQSIGIDGLSQSFNTTSSATNAGYGARLLQYQKEIKDVLPRLERYYKGIRLRVV